ncbi:cyclin H;1 [Actinidia rufa]|uniref:Cyclin H1 n=1 Tax=Actinidia rufa TaxID=165716 RepID=A0A7J0FR84_9ERIC|nr:cyclin H;1 [Actinidia rufa]
MRVEGAIGDPNAFSTFSIKLWIVSNISLFPCFWVRGGGAIIQKVFVSHDIRGSLMSGYSRNNHRNSPIRSSRGMSFEFIGLALAALRKSNEVHGVLDLERYLESLLSRQHSTHTISELTVSLNAIDSLVSKHETPTATDMKHIDRKLKSCRDPSSHEKSKKRKHRSKETSNPLHA